MAQAPGRVQPAQSSARDEKIARVNHYRSRCVDRERYPGRGVPPMLEIKNLTKSYGDVAGPRPLLPGLEEGRGPGPARPQRRGQDDAHLHPGRDARRFHRDRELPGPEPLRRPRAEEPPGHRAPGHGLLRRAQRHGQPALLGRALRRAAGGPEEAGRRSSSSSSSSPPGPRSRSRTFPAA
ncbi:MAG: hypothetical protein MZU84_08480 [Sphingobacterium sp.]|nr:hypothetical protein [Sphingobacterium sp.]